MVKVIEVRGEIIFSLLRHLGVIQLQLQSVFCVSVCGDISEC